jgi:hypothetical protein
MKRLLSERTIVAVLFVLVFITFSLAHEDTKKMESLYQGANPRATSFKPFMTTWPVQANNNATVSAVPASYQD